MLYAFTVLFKVYQLRRLGQRLAPEEVQATERTVRLAFGPHPMHPGFRASLLTADTGAVICYIDRANLKRMHQGCLMFGGSEAHRGGTDTYQAWWCVPAFTAVTR